MPVTTVFEIGEGRFTVVLYPETTTTTTSSAGATTTTAGSNSIGSGSAASSARQTTRTATKSIEANIHQVSTSLSPTPTGQSNSNSNISSHVFPYVNPNTTYVWGETTTVLDDGSTWTASPDVVTWTSGSGVYTTEVWGLVPEQGSEGSETGVQGMNKKWVARVERSTVVVGLRKLTRC